MVLIASPPSYVFLSAFNIVLSPVALAVLFPLSSYLTTQERLAVPVPSKCTTTHMILAPPADTAAKGRIFFLHGWPDSLVLFYEHAQAMREQGFECVLMQLPGYPVTTTLPVIKGTLPRREWGYSFKEVVDAVAFTMQTVNAELGPSKGEVCLCNHDWGAFTSYLLLSKYTPAELGITRMVTLDVGLRKVMPAKMGLLVLLYQTFLNIAWIMPRFIGDAMTRAFAYLLNTPAKEVAQASQNGLYREVWRTMALKEWQELKPVTPKAMPWLFCYGTEGPEWSRWSDDGFYAEVRASHATSRVEAFDSDHWFFCHGQHKQRFLGMLADWMRKQ